MYKSLDLRHFRSSSQRESKLRQCLRSVRWGYLHPVQWPPTHQDDLQEANVKPSLWRFCIRDANFWPKVSGCCAQTQMKFLLGPLELRLSGSSWDLGKRSHKNKHILPDFMLCLKMLTGIHTGLNRVWAVPGYVRFWTLEIYFLLLWVAFKRSTR